MTHTIRECYIEHRGYLTDIDYAGADDLLREGMPFDRVLAYVRGWATDYALEAEIETEEAIDFEKCAH